MINDWLSNWTQDRSFMVSESNHCQNSKVWEYNGTLSSFMDGGSHVVNHKHHWHFMRCRFINKGASTNFYTKCKTSVWTWLHKMYTLGYQLHFLIFIFFSLFISFLNLWTRRASEKEWLRLNYDKLN